MTGFPDFTRMNPDFASAPVAPTRDPWRTPEGIPVQPCYGPADLQGGDLPGEDARVVPGH